MSQDNQELPDLDIIASAHNAMRASVDMYGRMLVAKHSAMIMAQRAHADLLVKVQKLEAEGIEFSHNIETLVAEVQMLRAHISALSNGAQAPSPVSDSETHPGAS